jgi:hypothetical protein
MRLAVFAALSSLVLLASGCKSQCRILSEKVCDCTVTSTERNQCLARYASIETNNMPTAAQEDTCESFMETCDCRLLDTQAGKERCGIAVGADAGL